MSEHTTAPGSSPSRRRLSVMIRVAKAIRWQNGMVMVFGFDGEQIPELQGPYTDRRDDVLAAADDETIFQVGVWKESLTDVTKADW